MRVHIGATWRMRLKRPRAAATRSFCRIALATCCYSPVADKRAVSSLNDAQLLASSSVFFGRVRLWRLFYFRRRLTSRVWEPGGVANPSRGSAPTAIVRTIIDAAGGANARRAVAVTFVRWRCVHHEPAKMARKPMGDLRCRGVP